MSLSPVDGSQQAWMEFVKLARTAQARNPALAATAAPRQPAVEALKSKFAAPTSFVPPTSTTGSAEPKKYTRILGNVIDTYA